MKRNLILYGGICLLWWAVNCEFEVPTTPRLPYRWNSKVILPLLRKTYSFAELLFDSTADSTNNFFANTQGEIYYEALDSGEQNLEVADNYWIIPKSDPAAKIIHLGHTLDGDSGEVVGAYQTALSGEVNTSNNRIYEGIISDASSALINQIQISASLTDSLRNDLKIRFTSQNIRDNLTHAFVVDSLLLPANTLDDSAVIDISSDSLFSGDLDTYLDSLVFRVDLEVSDTLRQALSGDLTISLDVADIEMEEFRGSVNASGDLVTQYIIRSPTGARDIDFSGAGILFTVEGEENFQQIRFIITGHKIGREAVVIDTSFVADAESYSVDIGAVMSNLPDRIAIVTEASLTDTTHSHNTIDQSLSVSYSISAPLVFTLPPEMFLASARATKFYINDSTTRAKIARSQNGAGFDVRIENRTPFQGQIALLISTDEILVSGAENEILSPGYEQIGDSLFHISGTDTQLVVVDTLMILDIPAPVINADTVYRAGISNQFYLADSATVSLIADSCYFIPKFRFLNPDTLRTTLKQEHSITIESYLDLLFDAGALNRTETDTTDSGS